jgi:hypothetical protein
VTIGVSADAESQGVEDHFLDRGDAASINRHYNLVGTDDVVAVQSIHYAA